MIVWIILAVLVIALIIWYRSRLTEAGRMITKGVLIYVSAAGCLISAAVLVFVLVGIAEAVQENSVAERLESIEYHYQKGNYSRMREMLFLDNCFEPEFDSFWEAAEAQQAYHEYIIYDNALRRTDMTAQETEKVMQQVKKSREKVFSIQADSTFPKNRAVLAHYAELVR